MAASTTAKGGKRAYAPRLPPAERREQIFDAALEVIAEHGYAGASMEAIARQAGVTKPVVYDLFGNRGELLRALLEREENRVLEQLAGAVPAAPPVGDDPDKVLVEGVVAFLRAVSAHPNAWRLILMPADGTPEIVREHVEEGRRRVADQLSALIEWGLRARGGPEIDTELAAWGLIAAGEQTARLVLADEQRFAPERIGEFVAALLGALGRG